MKLRRPQLQKKYQALVDKCASPSARQCSPAISVRFSSPYPNMAHTFYFKFAAFRTDNVDIHCRDCRQLMYVEGRQRDLLRCYRRCYTQVKANELASGAGKD